jgi:3-oxoacyl-(acyl-carrier-protein) synthase
MSRRRVVVTGLGVVTPLGCELDDVWAAVCAGKSGVGPVQRFDCRDFKVRFGGEIRDFDPLPHLPIREQRAAAYRSLQSVRHGCCSKGDQSGKDRFV